MRYWDSSALVPLLVEEASSDALRLLLQDDDNLVTWSWTQTEVVSAIERRCRESNHFRSQRREIMADFSSFASFWYKFSEMPEIQSRAAELLARYPLRAADAGHLAAALIYRKRSNEPLEFVCLDKRLAHAAEQEGFRVVLPDQTERHHCLFPNSRTSQRRRGRGA